MEEFYLIYLIIAIIWSILVIILFFKVWGMTNNVKYISENIISQPDIVTQFAWAYSENLTRKAIESDAPDFTINSFEGIISVSPYALGGFFVESSWVVSQGNSNSFQRTFTSVISCPDLSKLMKIESWTVSLVN